jgi:hypothetical protein
VLSGSQCTCMNNSHEFYVIGETALPGIAGTDFFKCPQLYILSKHIRFFVNEGYYRGAQ